MNKIIENKLFEPIIVNTVEDKDKPTWIYRSINHQDTLFPKCHKVKPINENPIAYGATTEVRLVKIEDRIVIEKLQYSKEYILKREYEITQKLSKTDHMKGWFIPIIDLYMKYNKVILSRTGKEKDVFAGWVALMKPVAAGSLGAYHFRIFLSET